MIRLALSTVLLVIGASAPRVDGTGDANGSHPVQTAKSQGGTVVDALVDLPPPRARRAIELRAAGGKDAYADWDR